MCSVDEQVSHKDGIAVHVSATKVERPRHIVERRDEHTVGMKRAQGLADTCELIGSALSGIFQRLYLHAMVGDCRAVTPYDGQRVEVVAHGDATFLAQISNHRLHAAAAVHHTVHTDDSAVDIVEFLTEPLRNGRRTLHLEFHQLILGTAQLVSSCKEIAAVSPQRGTMHRDHSRTRRAVEATHPLAALPPVGHILTVVGVGTGKDKRIEMFTAHHLTQVAQPLIDHFFHSI